MERSRLKSQSKAAAKRGWMLLSVGLLIIQSSSRAADVGGPNRDFAFIGFYSNSPETPTTWLGFEQRTGYAHLFISTFKVYWDAESTGRFAEDVFKLKNDRNDETHVPFITFEGWGVSGAGPSGDVNKPPDRYGYIFPEFNRTAWQNTIATVVSAARTYGNGRPILIRPAHEMNFVGLYEWSKHEPKAYQAFWNEMADVVRAQDADDIVKLVWCPLLLPLGDNYTLWYPTNSSNVDWIGADIYSLEVARNLGQRWTTESLLETLYADFWQDLGNLGKPVVIAEAGSDIQDYKSLFLTELYDSIATNTDLHFIRAIIWFDAENEYDNTFRIPAEAFRGMMAKWGVWPGNSTGFYANALAAPAPTQTPTPPTNDRDTSGLLAIFGGGTAAIAIIAALLALRKRRQLKF